MEKGSPRILAIYLPQYHETADNNKWYGQGFTDWVAVKEAESYFLGHKQPKVPLGQNYYDLSQKETLLWQAELAKRYGIDGFSFYHYYFKDGKMELESPAEKLLQWKDINMPFCFNWASSSWVRSWSRFGGNSWADKYDDMGVDLTGDVLVEQNYGSTKDWKAHFQYLLPFFRDSRYLRIDSKPIFIFLNAGSISSLDDMVACWREEADKSGLKGLYLIGNTSGAYLESMDAYMIYEPANCLSRYRDRHKIVMKNGVKCFQYDVIWNEILQTPAMQGKKTYYCGLSGYDTTPRRGRDGEVVVGATPDIFKEKFTKLIQKSIKRENELIFIDAWNEWGEGMQLEPDEENGYKYLEATKQAMKDAIETMDSYVEEGGEITLEAQLKIMEEKLKKLTTLFNWLNRWCVLQEEGKLSFRKLLERNQVSTLAVYGVGVMGKHLINQLKRENINIAYVIDRYASFSGELFKVYRPETDLPEADMIIITAYDNGEIARELQIRGYVNTVYLADIVNELSV